MLSTARYQGEAAMAASARDAATGETRVIFDKAWAAHTTAARHAMLADRWKLAAAAARQAAAQLPSTPGLPSFLIGSTFDVRAAAAAAAPATGDAASESMSIAQRHEAAAEEWHDKGVSYMAEATADKPSSPAPAPHSRRSGK